MTNLTIEELDRLENMTPAEMIDEPEFMQAVYGKMASLCRRVLEAQDKGGKMITREASSAMAYVGSGGDAHTGWRKPLHGGMRPSSSKYDDSERAMNCFEAMHDSATDMLANEEETK